MKLLYKPFGLLLGILAGLIGRQLFNVVWGRIDEEEPPEATTEQAPLPKVLLAAALQGAIFAAVRAAVSRGGARGFAHLTGSWPGERRPDPAG
jgi:H+/Cl- antiporter ClcA